MGRIVSWFSCGAASAAATKLAIQNAGGREVVVAYCDTFKREHPDNRRFFDDCQRWFGQDNARMVERIAELERGILNIATYPMGSGRCTDDGYPTEISYNEITYHHLVNIYRSATHALLNKENGQS